MASASSISFATDRRRNASLALVCFALAALLSQRAWSEDEPMPFKLSLGDYHVSGGGMPSGPGLDVKLRYSYGNEDSGGHVWLGYFRSTALDIAQPRAGWDARLPLGPVRVLPSLQAASGGFLGGSLAVETGDTWVVGGGLGRTNLRPYANLNFDPNDSLTVYGGYNWPDNASLMLSLIRDNRQNPGQQNLHLVYRQPLHDHQSVSIDLLEKQGDVDGRFIRRFGLQFSYEWARYMIRAAWDPYVNFTPQNMVRVSVATRF